MTVVGEVVYLTISQDAVISSRKARLCSHNLMTAVHSVIRGYI